MIAAALVSVSRAAPATNRQGTTDTNGNAGGQVNGGNTNDIESWLVGVRPMTYGYAPDNTRIYKVQMNQSNRANDSLTRF